MSLILVTGGTGKIGTEVVRLLDEAGANARALVRSPEKAKGWKGVEAVKGDLDDAASVASALRGADTLFLLTQANPKQELALLESAKGAGVKKVVKISSMGASATSPTSLARGHAEVEATLEASGLAWTILRPGAFAQNFLLFASAIKASGRFTASVKDGKIAPIDARDIAAVSVKALLEPGHEGKRFTLTGPRAISYAEAAKSIAEAIGQPVTYVDVPPAETREAIVRGGMPPWFADDMIKMQAAIASGAIATVTGDVEAVTGKKARSFDEFARDHASAFR